MTQNEIKKKRFKTCKTYKTEDNELAVQCATKKRNERLTEAEEHTATLKKQNDVKTGGMKISVKERIIQKEMVADNEINKQKKMENEDENKK